MRALSLLLLLALVGCASSEPSGPEEGASAGHGWVRQADSPLSPRSGPVAAFVDGKAVFIGGDLGPPCPPGADCATGTSADDGAAYDVETRTWSPIATAPTRVPAFAPVAVIGNDVHIRAGAALLTYDATADRWATTRLRGPFDIFELVADGPRLLLVSGSDETAEVRDRVLDTRTGRWTRLPDDPFGRSFDRQITPTDDGVVLTAQAIGADGLPADPSLVQAALLPRGSDRWQRLPDSDQLGGGRFTWTGDQLVDAATGGADGGEVNGYGRTIPFGGRLDPGTGEWSRLPGAPKQGTGGWSADARGGPVMAVEGWLYDDRAGSWTRLTRLAGAPSYPGVAVWAGRDLLVLGGEDAERSGDTEPRTADEAWSTGLWSYRS